MEQKLLITLILVVIVGVVFLLWNNMTLGNILKIAKKGEHHLPDEKYFDLKYQMQYLVFAFILVVTFIGVIGYTSLLEIKTEVLTELNKMTVMHIERVDSLVDSRIDIANSAITNSSKETQKSLDEYINSVKDLNKKIGYNNMYIIHDLVVNKIDSKVKTITFKELGFKSFSEIPCIFIEPRGDAIVKLIKITKDSFDVIIDNKNDSTVMSLMIFY